MWRICAILVLDNLADVRYITCMNTTTATDLGIPEVEFTAMFGEPVSQEPLDTFYASTDEAGYIELAKMLDECRFVYVDSGGDGYCDRHGHWVARMGCTAAPLPCCGHEDLDHWIIETDQGCKRCGCQDRGPWPSDEPSR